MKKNKISFGPEYGINPPNVGIEEFMYFTNYVADVNLKGMFLIKYRHIESDRVTKVTISPQSLVASGALDLDKLKEFLK